MQNSSIPVFAVVDFDPDGLAIMSTYKHGSQSLAHQNEQLIVPEIQWLGIRSSDLLLYSQETQGESQGLLDLTLRDRRLAVRMLEKAVFQAGVETEWRRELQVMLILNMKAEIQIMSNGNGFEAWLSSKIHSATTMESVSKVDPGVMMESRMMMDSAVMMDSDSIIKDQHEYSIL